MAQATNWYRRYVKAWRRTRLDVVAYYDEPGKPDIRLVLCSYVGDDVERVRVEMSVDEAKALRATLDHVLARAEGR